MPGGGDRGSSSVYKSYDTSHRKSSVLLGVESGIHKHQVNGLYQEVFYLHLSHTGENMGFKRSVYLLLFGLDWLVFCRHADIRRIKMVCVFRGEWSGVGGEPLEPDWFGCNSDNRPPRSFTAHNTLINAAHPQNHSTATPNQIKSPGYNLLLIGNVKVEGRRH